MYEVQIHVKLLRDIVCALLSIPRPSCLMSCHILTRTAKLDKYDAKATELSDAFKQFKREIARESRNSRNGKPIKLKVSSVACDVANGDMDGSPKC